MAVSTFEAFSVSHAAVLDGTTTADNVTAGTDIYGVEEASITPNSDEFANNGDDQELSYWYWMNNADVVVRGGYLSMETAKLITGAAITSSGTGASQMFKQNLWQDDTFNTAPFPLLIRCPSRDSGGVVRTLDFVLYKVQCKPMEIDGPRYKDGLKVSFNGKALLSTADETGTALGSGRKAVGRIVSRMAL